MSTIINKIAIAAFKDRKVMMVREKRNPEIFYTLGGRIEPGESEIECLKREVQEEIGCDIAEDSIVFLHEFHDVAHDQKDTDLVIRLYTGELIGIPRPDNEIEELRYIDSSIGRKHLTTTGVQFLAWLKDHDYIA